MKCPVCGRKYCYTRMHESQCECGTFNIYVISDNEFAFFKCPNCGKQSQLELEK